jgi:hypothetical protein
MNTATRDTALSAIGGHVTRQDRQVRQPRRSFTLFEKMSGQYWRIARRRRVLRFISQIFRNDLTIYPLQYEEAIAFLIALRRAAERAQEFYSGLDPQSMRQVSPWGTIAKLQDFESQTTELLLCIVAMYEASAQEQIFIRVQMHVVIRQLFPAMLTSFDDLTSQLRALLEKVQEHSVGQGG